RKEEVEKQFGKFKGVRSVATRIFMNRLLMPGIELPGAKKIGYIKEDLRNYAFDKPIQKS
ncbi:MAG TPA: hypothetical protein VFQ43_02805, partial [Nitrososphaera sp.]|nr:hypothetical protein [Nitrososphaera sp.]